jgi:hypothetical protein
MMPVPTPTLIARASTPTRRVYISWARQSTRATPISLTAFPRNAKHIAAKTIANDGGGDVRMAQRKLAILVTVRTNRSNGGWHVCGAR